MDVKDKVVWVTGGTSGIGRATAQMFHEKGAKVMITGRNIERGSAVVAPFGDDGLFLQANMDTTSDLENALSKLLDKWGKIDILVNCAAETLPYPIITPDGPGALDQFEREIRVNLIGAYDVARLAGYAMTKKDPYEGGERGVIIQISSLASVVANPMISGYCAAKAGLLHLSKVLATGFAPYGIRVNAIQPGYIRSGITESKEQNPFVDIEQDIPINLFPKKIGEPEVIASTILFMVENSYINKSSILVDGGVTGRS
jgi:NAD(P)-dependent dehydrogenase (short-subunit alcohol dehydrogenase family)